MNTIWEITHFCKIHQGCEFKTGHGPAGENRVLLRHFNSGKLLAVAPNNLPYLQDFKENQSYRDEGSKVSLSSHPKKDAIEEEELPKEVQPGFQAGFAVGQSEGSLLQGYSVGASRSQSGSEEERNRRSRSESEDGSSPNFKKHDEELFDFKVEDSFANDDDPEEEYSDKHNPDFSVKVPDGRQTNPLHRAQSNELTLPQIEEPSLAPNDPPIIKKQPIGTDL